MHGAAIKIVYIMLVNQIILKLTSNRQTVNRTQGHYVIRTGVSGELDVSGPNKRHGMP